MISISGDQVPVDGGTLHVLRQLLLRRHAGVRAARGHGGPLPLPRPVRDPAHGRGLGAGQAGGPRPPRRRGHGAGDTGCRGRDHQARGVNEISR